MLLTLKSLIKEHARLGFLYIFSTILNSQIITLLAYQIKKINLTSLRVYSEIITIFSKKIQHTRVFWSVCLWIYKKCQSACLMRSVHFFRDFRVLQWNILKENRGFVTPHKSVNPIAFLFPLFFTSFQNSYLT